MEAKPIKPRRQICLAFILFLLIIYLSGCAGKTLVLKPLEAKQPFSSVEISEGDSAVNVPTDFNKAFRQVLEEYIYEERGFQKGKDLCIKYSFVQYNPGSQFKRWLSGGIGGWGKGTLRVEVKFVNQMDQELARIQVEGELSGGALGGGFEDTIYQCVRAIAKYAKQNFK